MFENMILGYHTNENIPSSHQFLLFFVLSCDIDCKSRLDENTAGLARGIWSSYCRRMTQ